MFRVMSEHSKVGEIDEFEEHSTVIPHGDPRGLFTLLVRGTDLEDCFLCARSKGPDWEGRIADVRESLENVIQLVVMEKEDSVLLAESNHVQGHLWIRNDFYILYLCVLPPSSLRTMTTLSCSGLSCMTL